MSAVRGEGVAETETSRVVKVYIEAFVDLRFSKMVDAARGVWVYVRERFERSATIWLLDSEDPMCSSFVRKHIWVLVDQ